MEDSNACCPVVDVNLRVLLPENKSIILNVKRNSNSKFVFTEIIRQLSISGDSSPYLSLFEMIDLTFERKLQSEECPHNIYIQNYSSAAPSCILFKKWCFNIEIEKDICSKDAFFKRICFYQAVNDVNNGVLNVPEKLYQLKALQVEEKMDQYLLAVRQLNDYGRIKFPECSFTCNDDKGMVKTSFGYNNLILKLIKNGSRKEKTITIDWKNVKSFQTLTECQNFSIMFLHDDSEVEIKIGTFFVSFFLFLEQN